MKKILLFIIFIWMNNWLVFSQTITITATDITDNSFTVSWPYNSNYTYNLYVDGVQYFTGTSITTFYLSELRASTTYQISVSGIPKTGTVNISGNLSVKTKAISQDLVVSTNYASSSEHVTLRATRSIRLIPGFHFNSSGGKVLVGKIVPAGTLSTKSGDPGIKVIPEVTIKQMDTEIRPKVILFPNPIRDNINISLGSSVEYIRHLEIYNTAGVLIEKRQARTQTEVFNLNSQPPGLYILRVVYKDGKSESHKFIVTK